MSGSFTAACVQLASGTEAAANLAAAAAGIRRARSAGADFILTPETTDLMDMRRRSLFEKVQEEAEHRGLAELRDLAAGLGPQKAVSSPFIIDRRTPRHHRLVFTRHFPHPMNRFAIHSFGGCSSIP